MVADDPLRLVPAALIYPHHAAPDAGDAAVGQEVGRVGEDHVHGLLPHPAQQLQGVGLVQAQAAIGAGVERRGRVGIAGAGFLNQIGGQIDREIGDGGHQSSGAGRRIGGAGEVKQVGRGGQRGVGQGSDSSQGESDPILPDPRRQDQEVLSGVCPGVFPVPPLHVGERAGVRAEAEGLVERLGIQGDEGEAAQALQVGVGQDALHQPAPQSLPAPGFVNDHVRQVGIGR